MKGLIDNILSKQVKYISTISFQLDGKRDVYDRVWQLWVISWAFININIWMFLGEPKINSYVLVIVCVGIPAIALFPLKKYLNKFDASPITMSKKSKFVMRIKSLLILVLFISVWTLCIIYF